jgi:phospholipid/cholesterol/gamma-HCH transport system substrate-binding protein
MAISTRIKQLAIVLVFAVLCGAVFAYLWVNSGGKIPGITKENYRVTAYFPRVANLVYFADVMVAGVKVGKVQTVDATNTRGAQVVMDLNSAYPLHQGATAQIRSKTLVEESFVQILDGTGPALPSGTVLPPGSGLGPTQLNDVLLSFDSKTRAALAEAMRSLGGATEGTQQAFSQVAAGLGSLGRGGRSTLDALADQSKDLKELTGHTATLLAALNTQRGQIANLVQSADRLTTATSDGRKDLADVIRQLPPTLRSARNASDSLTALGRALDPVARNLREAAPDLNDALDELRPTAADLRRLVPDLDLALKRAPDTLHRVPRFTDVTNDLIPQAKGRLTDLNPILGYLKPYGADIAAFLPNFAQTLAHGDANGNYFRAFVPATDQSYRGYPVSTNIGPLRRYNPYPEPGQGYDPKGAGRNFTRVTKEPPG